MFVLIMLMFRIRQGGLPWIASILFSAAPVFASPDVFRDIYRAPSSAFPSGQIKWEVLAKSQVGESYQQWVLIEINGAKSWLERENLYLPEDFETQKNKAFRAYALGPLDIFRIPDLNSKPVGKFAAGSELDVEWNESTGDWVKSKIGNIICYLHKPNIITSIDLSTEVQSHKGQWYHFLGRDHQVLKALPAKKETLLFSEKEKANEAPIDLSIWEIGNFKLAKDRGVLKVPLKKMGHSEKHQYVIGHPVRIIEQKVVRWNKSKLDDHGEVWWLGEAPAHADETKMPPRATPELSLNKKAKKIKLSELLKKDLVDIDYLEKGFLSKKDFLGLSSAQGIWLSRDGENWEQLTLFGSQNHAVAVSQEGTLFVDVYYSRDQGKTFEKFFRLDQLAALTWRKRRQHPKFLQIKKIDLPDKSHKQIKLTLDIGLKENVVVMASLENNKLQWVGEIK